MKYIIIRNFSFIFSLFLLTGVINTGFSQNNPGTGQTLQDFATSTEWESYFNQKVTAGNKIIPEEYARAAKKAFSENNFILSAIWFDEAKNGNYTDPEMYKKLAAIYQQLGDGISEKKAMEYYLSTYPDGPDAGVFREKFFDIYLKEKNELKIAGAWSALADSSRNKESNLNKYFIFRKETNKKEACDSLAKRLLDINPKHIGALEWLGEKYYWLAENKYIQTTKKYENNKTSLQHLMLTQDFDTISAEFRKSLGYFESLWEISQSPRYATFLANIHIRFKNPQKADYYKKFIK